MTVSEWEEIKVGDDKLRIKGCTLRSITKQLEEDELFEDVEVTVDENVDKILYEVKLELPNGEVVTPIFGDENEAFVLENEVVWVIAGGTMFRDVVLTADGKEIDYRLTIHRLVEKYGIDTNKRGWMAKLANNLRGKEPEWERIWLIVPDELHDSWKELLKKAKKYGGLVAEYLWRARYEGELVHVYKVSVDEVKTDSTVGSYEGYWGAIELDKVGRITTDEGWTTGFLVSRIDVEFKPYEVEFGETIANLGKGDVVDFVKQIIDIDEERFRELRRRHRIRRLYGNPNTWLPYGLRIYRVGNRMYCTEEDWQQYLQRRYGVSSWEEYRRRRQRGRRTEQQPITTEERGRREERRREQESEREEISVDTLRRIIEGESLYKVGYIFFRLLGLSANDAAEIARDVLTLDELRELRGRLKRIIERGATDEDFWRVYNIVESAIDRYGREYIFEQGEEIENRVTIVLRALAGREEREQITTGERGVEVEDLDRLVIEFNRLIEELDEELFRRLREAAERSGLGFLTNIYLDIDDRDWEGIRRKGDKYKRFIEILRSELENIANERQRAEMERFVNTLERILTAIGVAESREETERTTTTTAQITTKTERVLRHVERVLRDVGASDDVVTRLSRERTVLEQINRIVTEHYDEFKSAYSDMVKILSDSVGEDYNWLKDKFEKIESVNRDIAKQLLLNCAVNVYGLWKGVRVPKQNNKTALELIAIAAQVSDALDRNVIQFTEKIGTKKIAVAIDGANAVPAITIGEDRLLLVDDENEMVQYENTIWRDEFRVEEGKRRIHALLGRKLIGATNNFIEFVGREYDKGLTEPYDVIEPYKFNRIWSEVERRRQAYHAQKGRKIDKWISGETRYFTVEFENSYLDWEWLREKDRELYEIIWREMPIERDGSIKWKLTTGSEVKLTFLAGNKGKDVLARFNNLLRGRVVLTENEGVHVHVDAPDVHNALNSLPEEEKYKRAMIIRLVTDFVVNELVDCGFLDYKRVFPRGRSFEGSNTYAMVRDFWEIGNLAEDILEERISVYELRYEFYEKYRSVKFDTEKNTLEYRFCEFFDMDGERAKVLIDILMELTDMAREIAEDEDYANDMLYKLEKGYLTLGEVIGHKLARKVRAIGEARKLKRDTIRPESEVYSVLDKKTGKIIMANGVGKSLLKVARDKEIVMCKNIAGNAYTFTWTKRDRLSDADKRRMERLLEEGGQIVGRPIWANNYIVVRDEYGQIVGMVGLKERADGYEVKHLVIDMRHRGKGLAKEMLKMLKYIGNEEKLYAIVRANNERARRLFEELGFVAEREFVSERTGNRLVRYALSRSEVRRGKTKNINLATPNNYIDVVELAKGVLRVE